MKRSKLYEMVWQQPMTKVAAELGLSDVGLAKLCRRHSIPVPPRGHWAKVAAGKPSESIALSYREQDSEIALPDPSARSSDDSEAKAAAPEVPPPELDARALAATRLPPTLDAPHPLVKATAAYCQRIPKLIARYERTSITDKAWGEIERPPQAHHGRYMLTSAGCLCLTASLARMDWVLRFHDSLFKSLTLAGAKIVLVPADKEHGERVAADLCGERVFISFREGYRRVEIDPAELAKLRAKWSWSSAWRHEPSGKFTLQWIGTETGSHVEFTGTDKQLEARLPEVVCQCLHLLQSQPAVRQARVEREESARRRAERDARARRIAEARAKQLENAFELAETHEQVEALNRFLHWFEKDLQNLVEPYNERGKVWLAVVRAELERANPYQRLLGECLSAEPWRSWPPDWWPEAQIEDE